MTSDRDLIVIDGSQGEGGGQVLRTSLALSVALGRAVRIENVRAGRAKPGLQRQHLGCVLAAAEVSGGEVLGAELRSTSVELRPGGVGARPGTYRFGVGSAGSTLLVLQTVLAPLCVASGPSELELEGGTHNPLAPPFDFIARSFLPLVGRSGARVELELLRHGFAPAGGGRIRARIEPTASPAPLELAERGEARPPRVEITLAHLPSDIAAREWAALQRATHWPSSSCRVHEVTDAAGPGNVVSVELASEHVTAICTAFGEKGVRAERVAQLVARDVKRYLASDAPVCEHLADQLMLPLALMAGGRYRATALFPHARTNAAVVNAFLPGAVTLEEHGVVVVRGLV